MLPETASACTRKLFTQKRIARFILTMNMERMFTEIDTNKRNVLHDGAL